MVDYRFIDNADKKTTNAVGNTVPGRNGGRLHPPWKKGEKVPGAGRPPTPVEIRDMCRMASPEAVEIAKKLMHKAKTERVKLLAVETVLDRGFGKPKQPVDVNVYSELSNTELLELAARVVAELGGAIAGVEASRADSDEGSEPVSG